MSNDLIFSRRRFTCLSPNLVRLEFSPDGVFEERRTLVAFAPKKALAFAKDYEENGVRVLDTGTLEIRTRCDEAAFFPSNLEARWNCGGLQQFWRPGDRDHRNLGGTLRSLDRVGDTLEISGVHIADGAAPNAKAAEWIAWLQCEEDPAYYQRSPNAPASANGDTEGSVRFGRADILERTRNAVLDNLRYPPGVLSRSGYFLLNDSDSPLIDDDGFPVARNRPGYQDWYLFAYGDDYKAALRDFVLLTGRAPLPPKHVFGLQYSRWPAFGEEESKQITDAFRSRGLPLSTLIVDMEWHRTGWGHWDWNAELFPDPARYFNWCHENDLAVVLNDHPLDVRGDDSHFEEYSAAAGSGERAREIVYDGEPITAIDVNMGDKREAQAFVEVCHRPISDLGLDYWWNDGCKGVLDGAINQLLANKLFWEEVTTPDRRGMLMARYGGLGSHRYGVFFTGDTLSCWEVLRGQCEFNIRAGGVGLAYVSHDIGGFYTRMATPLLDPTLYLRWLQFGALNPVFKFHSAPGSGSRFPWDYGKSCEEIANRWLRLRHSLQPHFYTAARTHYDSGVPIVRGLFLDSPGDEACYRFDEYLLGDGLLVAPVLTSSPHRSVYFPEGDWFEFESATIHQGKQEKTISASLAELPLYVRAGTILVRQNADAPAAQNHIAELLLDVYPGADGGAELYEDDGRTPNYQNGYFCRTAFTLKSGAAGGFTLSGVVTEGEPLADAREITVQFSALQAPQRALLAGRELEIQAESPAGRYSIALPTMKTTQGWELSVE